MEPHGPRGYLQEGASSGAAPRFCHSGTLARSHPGTKGRAGSCWAAHQLPERAERSAEPPIKFLRPGCNEQKNKIKSRTHRKKSGRTAAKPSRSPTLHKSGFPGNDGNHLRQKRHLNEPISLPSSPIVLKLPSPGEKLSTP